jgi:hypothetical protein
VVTPSPLLVWLTLATLAWMTAVAAGFRVRPYLNNTTLAALPSWMLAVGGAWGFWLLGLWATMLQENPRWAGTLDHVAYLAAGLSLCPPMLVLGARRPTNKAWVGFVIAPMIAVLAWPMVTLAMHGSWDRRLELETPHLCGYLLVVMMSYGNYVGGRLTLPALMIAVSLAGIGIATAQRKLDWHHGHDIIAACLFVGGAGVVGATRRLRAADWPADPFDRVWQEFSTLFGLVWSRRLLDRINAIAEKQQWPGRLHADGFHWDRPLDDGTRQQVDHALRWLLRRFVDVAWLDSRLGFAAMVASPLAIDT